MSYSRKDKELNSNFDYKKIYFLDWLYFYIKQDIQKEIIKEENRKPKEIRLFDKRKWTNDYVLKYELGRNVNYHLSKDFTEEDLI